MADIKTITKDGTTYTIKATRANLTTTANAVAYYTGTDGTFGTKASAKGALYATAANGALTFGTLPVAEGGTGATTFTSGNVLVGAGTSAITTIAKASANTASTLVQRDSSGNFSAGTITASLTGHASLDLPLTGGTMTGRITMSGKPINQVLTGSGTAGKDAGASADPRYFPAKWTFNGGVTATNGDIFTIKIPVAGHSYGVFMSVDNGTNYYPVVNQGTSRVTTHYPNGYYITVIFDSTGSAATMYALNGGNSTVTVSGGVFRVLNYYDTSYSQMSVSEMRTGTATSSRVIRADYLKTFLSTLGGTGLTFSQDATNGIILNHSNSVTAGTAGTSSATSGATLAVPYVTYDSEGHITTTGTHTHTINSLDTSAISSGTLGVARGGTGASTFTSNAVLYGNGTSAIQAKASANGALYATSANGALNWGTLPVAQGGTGQTSIANIQAGKDGSGNTITSTYVKKAGDTMTGELVQQTGGIWVQGGSAAGSNSQRMTLTSGMPVNLAYNAGKRGTRIYSNAIAFADPYNGNTNNDAGWIRHIEETANSGVLEIATGDDSTEPIVVRQYNTSSAVSTELTLLDASHNTIIPGRLTMSSGKPINQILTGSGTAASDAGESASPRYFPAKWTFNTGRAVINGDIYTIKIPVAGHSYGVFMSVNNGTNYYPVVANGTGRITTHYPVNTYIQVVFESSGSAASMTPVAGADSANGSTITGGVFRVINYYDANTTYTVTSVWCNTAAGTAAKVSSNATYYALRQYSYFEITMRYANTSASALTLNVNGTGAKPIYINGTASSSTNYTLPAGKYLVYYNGTNYYFRTDAGIQGGTWFGNASTASKLATARSLKVALGSTTAVTFDGSAPQDSIPVSGTLGVANGGTGATTAADARTNLGIGTLGTKSTNASIGQGYGTCATAAATAAKVVTLSNYELFTNGIVTVKFTYAVPANATLNINSKGAKNIFYKGAKIVAGIIDAGDTATFIYDGTQYQLISVDRATAHVYYGTSEPAASLGNVGDLYVVYTA